MAQKIRAAGRFGSRYGAREKKKLADVETLQRKKQRCPFCKRMGVKKIEKGIWKCKKCGKKFTGDVYYLK